MKPWFQVNLEEFVEVHAILIYRFDSKSTELIECVLIINIWEELGLDEAIQLYGKANN